MKPPFSSYNHSPYVLWIVGLHTVSVRFHTWMEVITSPSIDRDRGQYAHSRPSEYGYPISWYQRKRPYFFWLTSSIRWCYYLNKLKKAGSALYTFMGFPCIWKALFQGYYMENKGLDTLNWAIRAEWGSRGTCFCPSVWARISSY